MGAIVAALGGAIDAASPNAHRRHRQRLGHSERVAPRSRRGDFLSGAQRPKREERYDPGCAGRADAAIWGSNDPERFRRLGAQKRTYGNRTQPDAGTDDNIRMNETTGSDTPDVYGALWIGAFMLASGSIKAPFPAELEEVAARYFERFPPTTKA